MIQDLFRDALTRSLGAALMSADRVDGMLRPTLERCDVPPEEIERVVAEAQVNLRSWQDEVGGQLVGAIGAGLGAGVSVFLRRLGLPSPDELAALENPPARKAPTKKAPTRKKGPARKRASSGAKR